MRKTEVMTKLKRNQNGISTRHNPSVRIKDSTAGITLIALVITIIVLLILAGVAISMLSGENGILKQAANAKTNSDVANLSESIKLTATEVLTSKEHKLTEDEFKTELEKDGYKINEDGTVTESNIKYALTNKGAVKATIEDLKAEQAEMYAKVTLFDTNKEQIVIPFGFTIKSDSPITVKEGIVVVAPEGSEFVWVPVPDVIYDGTTEIKVGTYTPMARLQNGTTNYQGILYDLNQESGSQVVYDLDTYGVGTTKYREPSLLTGKDLDTYAVLETITGTSHDNGTDSTTGKKHYELAGYNSIKEFGKDMQDEYNNMVISVNKYKGFYVGRYETGIQNGKAVSKNAYTNEEVTTATASLNTTRYWYGLYNKQRTMAKDNKLTEVESSMIWGSQYDAMMNWMIKTGIVVGTGYDDAKWTKEIKITGQSEKDITNQVHDLYGCLHEWTLEAYLNHHRVVRGCNYNVRRSSSNRNSYSSYTPASANSTNGSRLTLYIK